jgi:hypothetical protein
MSDGLMIHRLITHFSLRNKADSLYSFKVHQAGGRSCGTHSLLLGTFPAIRGGKNHRHSRIQHSPYPVSVPVTVLDVFLYLILDITEEIGENAFNGSA